MLDLTSFQKAISILENALNAYQRDCKNDFIRDACIQRFEYSYELAHKMLRRYLETTEATGVDINSFSFAALIRLGYERGLLAVELIIWKSFRDARNITSHTYDEKKALEVLSVMPGFLAEAKHLLGAIQQKLALET